MSTHKHTPGPWRWYGSPKSGFYLATVHHGRRLVMAFDRLGMQGAQPTFQRDGLLVTGSELCRFEVAPEVVGMTEARRQKELVYRHDITGFDNPDATLIAAAPELLAAAVHAWTFVSDILETGMSQSEEVRALERALKDAIAKAKGGEE